MKATTIFVITILAAGLIYFVYRNTNVATDTAEVVSGDTISGDGKGASLELVSTEELSLHSTKDDCWLAINGTVYDVTKFIPVHPGKDMIVNGCGKDATELFETKGKSDSGMTHSERARSLLMSLVKVGDLEENQ